MSERKSGNRLLLTDLDGTLTGADGLVSEREVATLRALGASGVWRAVVTGRSLHGTAKVLPPDFPIDTLVFSSGAGVLDWRERRLLHCHHLSAEQIRTISQVLFEHELDFMLHHPIPGNHVFFYHASGRENPDFVRRRIKHAQFATELGEIEEVREASQFLVVVPPEQAEMLHGKLCEALEGFNVIRATSPLDGLSAWLEVFPPAVSKSQGSAWLSELLGIAREDTLAVGNDYNDLDLLRWAGRSYAMANSPAKILAEFPVVTHVSEAVKHWSV